MTVPFTNQVVTSSLEKTDDDVTSSALSLTTSEHDQVYGRSVCDRLEVIKHYFRS